MVSWVGFRQTALPYDRDARLAGETKYPIRRMMLFALDAVTGFSTLPLRLASLLGFVCAGFAFVFGLYVFGAWLFGSTVAGWTSVALLILFLGGTQLIVVGILGEYLGRLYMQSKARPLFVIEEVLRREAGEEAGEPRLREIGHG
jgi:dolichol-phosphate mannosyltransferase